MAFASAAANGSIGTGASEPACRAGRVSGPGPREGKLLVYLNGEMIYPDAFETHTLNTRATIFAASAPWIQAFARRGVELPGTWEVYQRDAMDGRTRKCASFVPALRFHRV